MIRLTRESDYAIVLMTCIARSGPRAVSSARELAEATHLPQPMVAKILKHLARAGLLRSRRGVAGGYRLARPAGRISVADVITALEGPIGITECTSDLPVSCDLAAMCAVRSNWEILNRAVREALSRITLEQMTAPLDAAAVAGGDGGADAADTHETEDETP